jgi:methylated-DNA-[protein]-cysteine S-methyltransferase
MTHYLDTFETPLGPFSIAVNATGAVVATAFGDETILQTRFAPCHVLRDKAPGREARKQVEEYFAGRRRNFKLSLAPQGTPFQQRVWAALQGVPFGETRSYGALATELGSPHSSRAVGRANATNPICLIIPCHRVIGADGALTGYAFGEEIKRRLIEHEGALQLA